MSLFEKIKNKRISLQEQPTDEQERTSSRKSKGRNAYSGGGNQNVNQNEKKTKNKQTVDPKYQRLRDQRTKYNVFKNKEGVYKPSIASAKAKMGERLTNITKPPDPKATQKNALNASPARIKKLNKAQRRAARFEPGAGVKEPGGKDYRTRILDRITKNQEANIDTSKKGRINRMRAGISATSPTIPSTTGKGRIPMPGAPNEVDFEKGGKGVNQKGIRTDRAVINRMGRDPDLGKPSKAEIATARREQEAYDRQVKKNQAQLKKKGGAKYYTGKDTPLNRKVLNRSDFNLQKVYDDLSSETGGRDRRKRAKNQPSYEKIKAQIDKKYPVKMGKTGLIPDKSTGAYGSANIPLKKPRKIKKIFTSSGSGGQKSFSIPKTKPTSRFGRMMTALKKNPRTAAAALAIGTGVYLYNKGKNPPKGIIPPVTGGGKIKGATTADINFTLGGKGGYGGSAGRKSKGAD